MPQRPRRRLADGLRELGHDGRRIQRAVEAGALLAVGRSWVVLPDADPAIAIALRGRGLVGGATALRTFGVWVTAEPPVQVATWTSTPSAT